jgi:hypothetical protein
VWVIITGGNVAQGWSLRGMKYGMHQRLRPNSRAKQSRALPVEYAVHSCLPNVSPPAQDAEKH